jgi:hypothetical protein
VSEGVGIRKDANRRAARRAGIAPDVRLRFLQKTDNGHSIAKARSFERLVRYHRRAHDP